LDLELLVVVFVLLLEGFALESDFVVMLLQVLLEFAEVEHQDVVENSLASVNLHFVALFLGHLQEQDLGSEEEALRGPGVDVARFLLLGVGVELLKAPVVFIVVDALVH